MDIRLGVMDNLNVAGAVVIEKIQHAFKGYDSVMHGVTEIGNSAHTFSLLIPVAAAIDMNLACDLLVSATVGEWTSSLLKWLLMEGRPYWWVRETAAYETIGMKPPLLMQTPLTCETGTGCPSGHTMHTSIVGFVILQWLLPKLDPRARWNADNSFVRHSLHVVYGLLIALVALSRIFIAAHFPHQCVIGALIGIPLAWYLTNCISTPALWWRNASQKGLLIVAAAMALVAISAYWLQRAVGVNPQWSVRLAFKWCSDPKFINVNTTNVFCLVRCCGTALGFAIAAPRAKMLQRQRVNILAGILLAVLVNVGLSAAQRAVPTSNFVTFYVAHYFLFAAMPILLVLPSVKSVQSESQPGDTPIPPVPNTFFRRSNEAMIASAVRKGKPTGENSTPGSSKHFKVAAKGDGVSEAGNYGRDLSLSIS